MDQILFRLADLRQLARELFDGVEVVKGSPLQTWSTDAPSGRLKTSVLKVSKMRD